MSGLEEVAQEKTGSVWMDTDVGGGRDVLRREGYMGLDGKPLYAPRTGTAATRYAEQLGKAAQPTGWLTQTVVPEPLIEKLPDYKYAPVESFARQATTPAGLASAGVGGMTAAPARALISELLANYGSIVAPTVAREDFGVEDPRALTAIGLASAGVGGVAGFASPSIARGAGRAARDLDARLAGDTILDPTTGQAIGGSEFGGGYLGPLARGEKVVADDGAQYTVAQATEGASESLVRVADDAGAELEIPRTNLQPIDGPGRSILGTAGRIATAPIAIPTKLAAQAYGRLPGLKKTGLGGMADEIVNAPDIDGEAGLLLLKDFSDTQNLPLSAKVSNAFWRTLGVANNRFTTRLDDPRTTWVGRVYQYNEQRAIPDVSAAMARMSSALEVDQLFELDDFGRVVTPDGRLLPDLTVDGQLVPRKEGGIREGAILADVAAKVSHYEAQGLISPQQAAALRQWSQDLKLVEPDQVRLGLKPETTRPDVAADGSYVPRGTPHRVGADEDPALFKGEGARDGRKPGASREAKYDSGAHAVEQGWAYPTSAVAISERYFREALSQVNAVQAANQLKQLPVEAGGQVAPLGAAQAPATAKGDLKSLRSEIAPLRREARDVQSRLDVVDRDVRFGANWLDRQQARLGQLAQAVADKTIDASARAESATEAAGIAKSALDDALAEANNLAKRAGPEMVAIAGSRKAYDSALKAAQEASAVIDDLSDKLARGDLPDTFTRTGKPVIEHGWEQAAKLRTEIAKQAKKIAESPAPGLGETAAVAKAAAAETMERLRDSLTTARQSARSMAKAEGSAAKAETGGVALLTEGKYRELKREIDARAGRMATAFGKQSELTAKLDELAQRMEPLRQRRAEILKDVQDARAIARQRDAFTAEIALEPLRGIKVPTRLANSFNKYVDLERTAGGGKSAQAAALFDLANDLYRTMGATLDSSRQLTVGLLGQYDNPGIAADAVATSIRTLGNSDAFWMKLRDIEAAALKDGLPPIREAITRDGLELAPGEVALGSSKSALRKLADKPGFKQAEVLFSVPGNIERVERYYATLRSQQGAGKSLIPAMRKAAANAANTTSGRASKGVLAPVVGDDASRRILFAGQWVEAQLEKTMNAILVGGIEGNEARQALLRLGIGVAGLTYVANKLLGNETNWDVSDPNGWRVRVAGHDLSLAGPWDTLVKGGIATAQGDPGYFALSKLAPIPSKAASAVGIGRDLDPSSIGGVDTYWKEALPLPFGARNIIDEALETNFRDLSEASEFLFGVGASALGAKAPRVTNWEKYQEEVAQDYATWSPKAATGIDYAKVKDPLKDPLFLAQWSAEHLDAKPSPTSKLGKALAAIRAEFSGTKESLGLSGENNKLAYEEQDPNGREFTLQDWRDARSNIGIKQRQALEPYLEKLKSEDPPKGSPSAWITGYFESFRTFPNGEIDSEATAQAQGEWLSENGEMALSYVNEFLVANADPGIDRTYVQDMQTLAEAGWFNREGDRGGASLPKYRNLVSSEPEWKLEQLERRVGEVRASREGWQDTEWMESAVVILYHEDKLPKEVVQDVLYVHLAGLAEQALDRGAGHDGLKFLSPERYVFKKDHERELAWFDPYATWSDVDLAAQK
ncbi:MAG: hypothetical protein WD557_01335 [Dehalococcoidia bacterium]